MLKLLVVVLVFAAVTYLVTRALQQSAGGERRPLPRPRPKRPSRPPRPVAPDDDDEFLRDLDRKRLDPPEEN